METEPTDNTQLVDVTHYSKYTLDYVIFQIWCIQA